jgi:hypothetical protein
MIPNTHFSFNLARLRRRTLLHYFTSDPLHCAYFIFEVFPASGRTRDFCLGGKRTFRLLFMQSA